MCGTVLTPAEVKVFYAEVPSKSAELLNRLSEWLSGIERARLRQFRFERDQLTFAAAHALLRVCLSHVAGRHDWCFRLSASGKPEIHPPFGDPPLTFNLTHTRGLVACVISSGNAVGIDAEFIDSTHSVFSIAQTYYAPSERRQLEAAEEAHRPSRFFQIWTLKEAVVKAIGDGLSIPLTEFALALDPPSVTFAPHLRQDPASWHVEAFAPGPTHHLGLAIKLVDPAAVAVRWHKLELTQLDDIVQCANPSVRSRAS